MSLDELKRYHIQRVKLNVVIILCKLKRYHCIDLEKHRSEFDQIRPVISHLEVSLPENPKTLKDIGVSLKGPRRQF